MPVHGGAHHHIPRERVVHVRRHRRDVRVRALQQDVRDQAEEAPYQEVKEGGYLFLGRIDLDDFNEVMGSNLPKDEADTLAGYIYGHLGRVPVVGESVRDGDLLLTVEQVSARRIRKVRATWVLPDTQTIKENNRADR